MRKIARKRRLPRRRSSRTRKRTLQLRDYPGVRPEPSVRIAPRSRLLQHFSQKLRNAHLRIALPVFLDEREEIAHLRISEDLVIRSAPERIVKQAVILLRVIPQSAYGARRCSASGLFTMRTNEDHRDKR